MGGSTCSGKVKLRDKKTKKDVSFGYSEGKSSDKGPGPRWINFWMEGQKGGKTKYDIDPNPHENSKKYPDKATDFYKTMGEALAGAVMADDDKDLPKKGAVKWQGVTYTLSK